MINLKVILPRNIRGKLMDGLHFLPDTVYLKLFYFAVSGKWMNLKNPKGFNEKLNWLKLNDIHPEYGKLVDKYAVREHINNVLGKEYLFPLLGKWNHFDEIDFDSLPESFVLKCNHDSGSTRIIGNKSALSKTDKKELRDWFEGRLRYDFYYAGREYPYKGLKRIIFAEKYMVDYSTGDSSIRDYKFLCFDGEPKVMYIATDRSSDCHFDFYDMEFNHLDITWNHPQSNKRIEKPSMFEEMKRIAKQLSKGMKFVRIDLYELNGKIYFGEYTFFHGGGFQPFEPDEWEQKLGSWIKLELNHES